MGADVLTSLSRAKAWAGVPDDNTSADAVLTALIKSASAFVLNYLNLESFGRQTFEEVYDGYGKTWVVLRQPNVLEVTRLVTGQAQTIPSATGDGLSTPLTNGYAFRNGRLELFGYAYPNGRGSVYVEYASGHYVSGESHTVPGSGEFAVLADRFWLSDGGVVLDPSGEPMVKVKADPEEGQYTAEDGKYTFNEANAEDDVLIAYSYAPEDVVQAVTELVGERYKYKDRIGHSSKSLGGQETVAFTANRTPDHILELLNSYRRVAPA